MTNEGRFKRTTRDERIHILKLINEGVSISVIANAYNIHFSTVWRIQKRYNETHSVEDVPRSPRRCKMPKRTFKICFRKFKQKKFQTLNILRHLLRVQYNIEYSKSGLRSYLKREGIIARLKIRKPILSKKNRLKRISFAKSHKNWTVDDWRRVVWTDESSFSLVRNCGREYHYIPSNDNRRLPTKATTRKGGSSIMIWGCFKNDQVGKLNWISGTLDSEGYQQIVRTTGRESIIKFRCQRSFIWMHDNARPHSSHSTNDFFDKLGWKKFDWPPQSPDLNPIENLWNILKNKVYASSQFTSIRELKATIESEWIKLDRSAVLKGLIESMPKRIYAVIANKGYTINY